MTTVDSRRQHALAEFGNSPFARAVHAQYVLLHDTVAPGARAQAHSSNPDAGADLVIPLPPAWADTWTDQRGGEKIAAVTQHLTDLAAWQSGLALARGSRFTSTEKVELTPEELAVDTVADFRSLLALVLERAGLTCGQIAAKTSIGRSSVYNLVDVRRQGLPTKGDQVQEFLCACGLQLRQVATVMRSWELLNAQRAKPTGKPAATVPPVATPIAQLSPRELLQECSPFGPKVRDFAIGDIGREFVRLRTLLPILFSIAILLGWRIFNTKTGIATDMLSGLTTPYTIVAPWAQWHWLVIVELLVVTLLVRWRLRRTAAPRLRAKGR